MIIIIFFFFFIQSRIYLFEMPRCKSIRQSHIYKNNPLLSFFLLFVCICCPFLCIYNVEKVLDCDSCVIDVDATYIIIINTTAHTHTHDRRCLLKQFISQMNDFSDSIIYARKSSISCFRTWYVFLTSHKEDGGGVMAARQQRGGGSGSNCVLILLFSIILLLWLIYYPIWKAIHRMLCHHLVRWPALLIIVSLHCSHRRPANWSSSSFQHKLFNL